MICFNTQRSIIYNKIIHNYLEIELFGDPEIDAGEMIECYMPTYLYREQYEKCIEVFEDLYHWTGDEFFHNLDAFHEVALYYFLIEMENVKNDLEENFEKIYYNEEINRKIDCYIKKELKEFDEEYSNEELKENYYCPDDICGAIYEDIDFAQLPHLYNEQKANFPMMAQLMGIDLDYYFEILPMDIQKQYKSKHITLVEEVSEFLSFLQQRINDGSLAELFFENENPINEKKIHVILENLMNAYFIGKGVDISREVLLKNGQVDFKLFRNDKKEEKVLIEVKKASSSYLKAGYEKQLCDYIRYSGCKNAFYMIVCFSDNDYKIANNFIKNHVYTDNFQMYINIALLDVRKKVAPSKKI
ncbi:MAG: hypothetical protein IKL55_00340 [Clostridia bacterium]|nr:hypothetical protein [Clostridia bacterium]